MNLGNYINLTKALDEVGALIRDEYKSKLKEKDAKGRNAIATGTLYNSVKYKITTNENFIYLNLILADHWVRVEYDSNWGTKPPPISKIRYWMIVKKINFGKGSEYKIQNSIKKKGIKGRHFLKKTMDEVSESGWKQKLNTALKKDINKIIKDKLKETQKTINNNGNNK